MPIQKVLIVDDETVARNGISRALSFEELGKISVLCSNGQKGKNRGR